MKLFFLALTTTLATFILLLIGGLVNPTGSSLACPDWPTCYGTFFPPMVGGILYEHTHRMVATTVGLLTCILSFFLWKKGHTKLAAAAVALVILQGLLGGMTVIFKLPLLISVAHLATALFFFLILILITYHLCPFSPISLSSHTPTFCLVTLILTYTQMILGAFVRHTGSGRICGTDILLCNGLLFPDWAPAQLHMMHRFFALGLLVWVTCFTLYLLSFRPPLFIKLLSLLAPSLIVLQILLGFLTVASSIGLIPVTLHLAIGTLLLTTVFLLYLTLKRSPS